MNPKSESPLAALAASFNRMTASPLGSELSVRQCAVLAHIHLSEQNEEARGVRAMAEALNLGKPAITRAVDRLVDLHFVTRKGRPDDKRLIAAQTTAAGRAFVTGVMLGDGAAPTKARSPGAKAAQAKPRRDGSQTRRDTAALAGERA